MSSYSPVKFVSKSRLKFVLKIRLRFNEFYCFCIFVNKYFANFRGKNSIILRIKNAESSGYHFCLSANMQGDFKFCISLPLNKCSHNFGKIFEKHLWRISFLVNSLTRTFQGFCWKILNTFFAKHLLNSASEKNR